MVLPVSLLYSWQLLYFHYADFLTSSLYLHINYSISNYCKCSVNPATVYSNAYDKSFILCLMCD